MRPIVKPRWPSKPRDSAGHQPRQYSIATRDLKIAAISLASNALSHGHHGPDVTFHDAAYSFAPVPVLVAICMWGRAACPLGVRPRLAASIVADQGMILPANDRDDSAADAGEESTDDEVGPPSHVESRLAHEFWRAIRAGGFAVSAGALGKRGHPRLGQSLALPKHARPFR